MSGGGLTSTLLCGAGGGGLAWLGERGRISLLLQGNPAARLQLVWEGIILFQGEGGVTFDA